MMPLGGRDLAVAALKERLTISDVRTIMTQIGHALSYLHSKRIVHGDVKLLVRLSFFTCQSHTQTRAFHRTCSDSTNPGS